MAFPDAARRGCVGAPAHHDGTSRTVQVRASARFLPEGRLIISRTDLNGVITHANDAFIELSGYTRRN